MCALIPVICFDGKVDVLCLKDGVLAFFALTGVVVESAESVLSENENDGDVDESHTSHQNVGDVPQSI